MSWSLLGVKGLRQTGNQLNSCNTGIHAATYWCQLKCVQENSEPAIYLFKRICLSHYSLHLL